MYSRTGVARLALTADVPVLPAVHWGTREVLDRYNGKFRPLPRKSITVRCGPPVDLSAYRGRPLDAALLREVTDLLMVQVRELLAEVRGEPAPEDFFRRTPPPRSTVPTRSCSPSRPRRCGPTSPTGWTCCPRAARW
jgi:hypothetical protein